MIFPDWAGKTVAVLGAGPSAAEIAPALAGRFPILAVNLSYRLVTPADVLYAADSSFWLVHAGARKFPGLKLSPEPRAQVLCGDVELVKIARRDGFMINRMIRDPLGTIGAGGNSSFQAINLAAQFGAARILLAGVDFTGEHWHGPHKRPLWNPKPDAMKKWRDMIDAEAETLASWNIEVLNLSKISTLRNYHHVSAEDLGRFCI